MLGFLRCLRDFIGRFAGRRIGRSAVAALPAEFSPLAPPGDRETRRRLARVQDEMLARVQFGQM